MKRPGDVLCLAMLGTLAMLELVHAKPWMVILVAFALGWFLNEREKHRNA